MNAVQTEFLSLQEEIKEKLDGRGIEFIGLQFTDLFGSLKCVHMHVNEFETVMAGRTMFDGSSVDGFAKVESSDLRLMPDTDTIRYDAYRPEDCRVAYMYCDVVEGDGTPSANCSRTMLKKVLREAKQLGYRLNLGIEGEFFLFETNDKGEPVHTLHDRAGYFDAAPHDRGERARMDIVSALMLQGFRLEAAHHEGAPGQHEIDFKYDEALTAADRWMTFRQIVKNVAQRHGLYASFLPKPFAGHNGNAMHCNQSLQDAIGANAFFDPQRTDGLSDTAMHYIAGLLRHARGMAAIANPIVNSYKRLKPGYEAPTYVAWSGSNRTALIRIPCSRGAGTRVELRTPDPTANPYLVFAVMLKAGLEGIRAKIEPAPEAVGNIPEMSEAERHAARIGSYPRDLVEAVEEMRRDSLIREVMGDEAFNTYIDVKSREAEQYAGAVHAWEIDRYLSKY